MAETQKDENPEIEETSPSVMTLRDEEEGDDDLMITDESCKKAPEDAILEKKECTN